MRLLKFGLLLSFTVLLLLIFGRNLVFAQQWCGGCQVGRGYTDPESGVTYYVDGCNGCTGTVCEPGEYQVSSGGDARGESHLAMLSWRSGRGVAINIRIRGNHAGCC